MLINTEKIISIINKKREEIYKCISNFRKSSTVSLIGEHNEALGTGVYSIGNVYWDKEVTINDLEYFTIQDTNIWLAADRAIVHADEKVIHLSL